MATVQTSTGTAADLLKYQKFDHLEKGARLTRLPTANQDWIVRDWDGETYAIRFTNNFSKKHLFTFTKSEEKVKAEAFGKPGTDEENWKNAEYTLLLGKIMRNLDKRAVANLCNCGHPFSAGSTQPRHPGGGACTGVGCGCTAFATPYGLARRYVHKPTEDPLSGAKTNKNTCLILNWVPREEFEGVVCKSIQAVEKPTGWTRGQPLAVPSGAGPASERDLKWDFGMGRAGAVIIAEKLGVAPWFNFANKQGCWIGARKTASQIGKQTWEIYHMLTQPAAHQPF